MRTALAWMTAVALTGCTATNAQLDQPGPGPATDTAASTPTGTPTTGTGATTTATGDTGITGPTYDCDTVPLEALAFRELPGAVGYHDVAFAEDGRILGTTTGFNMNLMATDYDGNTELLATQLGTVHQLAWLPSGDLAVGSETDGILIVPTTGGSFTLNANIRPYGLVLGPDELLYAADYDAIWRVDPNTGQAEEWMPGNLLPAGDPRVFNFNVDNTRMFIGTLSGNGNVYAVDVDSNFDRSGPVEILATGVGAGSYHDTMGIDACGYAYVADYAAQAMFRIHPTTGVVQTYLEANGGWFSGSTYGHGMEWGTGQNGWLEDAVYVTQPYNDNTVAEVHIGVPSKFWEGTVLNRP